MELVGQDEKAIGYIASGTGAYLPSARNQVSQIPAGSYRVGYSDKGMFFQSNDITTDTFVDVPGSTADLIRQDMLQFLESGDVYEKFGFVHKRAYLLHGVPGTGKTCLVASVAQSVVARGGVAILINDRDAAPHEFQFAKENLPGREICFIIEEFDQVYSDDLLNTLDGEDSVPSSILLCTTNYLDDVPSRVRNRPGRFDRVIEVGYPNRDERFLFLREKLLGDSEQAAKWAEDTQGMPYAYLAALVRDVQCIGTEYSASLDYLRRTLGLAAAATDQPKRKDTGLGMPGLSPNAMASLERAIHAHMSQGMRVRR